MYDWIQNHEVTMRKNKKITDEAHSVLIQMLIKNPEERLGSKEDIKEIEAHPFFRTLDFAKLERKEIDTPFKPKVKSDDDVSNIDELFLNTPLGESVTGKHDILAGVAANTDDNFVGFSYAPPISEMMS